jgi:hypothetical protein
MSKRAVVGALMQSKPQQQLFYSSVLASAKRPACNEILNVETERLCTLRAPFREKLGHFIFALLSAPPRPFSLKEVFLAERETRSARNTSFKEKGRDFAPKRSALGG